MRAVVYARYSSHAQREESIEGQLRVCHEYAQRAGYDVIKEYIDRALTGTNDNRPAFQEMVAASSSHAFDVVLMYALDRFARDRYDAAVYRKKLKDNGVRIISVTQPIDDSPEGVLIESLLEGLAEYYSKNLARGVMRGMKENALNCKAVGGIVPTGYKVDRTTMKYVIDEPMAAIIREVFDLYASGSSIVDICKYCNDHGYRTSKGRPFTRNSLSTILKNKKYIGVYKFDDIEIEGGMPVIVDKKVFDKVQERIAMGNKKKPRKHDDVEFLLTGKLFCGHCRKPMVGTSGTSKTGSIYYYYTCKNHGDNECPKKAERKDELEHFIIDYISRSFLSDENIEAMSDLIMEAINNDEWALMMRGLESEIRDVEARIGNLMMSLEFGGATIAPITNRIQELMKEKESLEKELADKKIENFNFLTKEMIQFWMYDMVANNDGSPEAQRKLINAFVNAIYIYDTDAPDDNNKRRKKRKIVIAFNTSGPERQVKLEFGQASDQSTTPTLSELRSTYVMWGGRVIVVILDY